MWNQCLRICLYSSQVYYTHHGCMCNFPGFLCSISCPVRSQKLRRSQQTSCSYGSNSCLLCQTLRNTNVSYAAWLLKAKKPASARPPIGAISSLTAWAVRSRHWCSWLERLASLSVYSPCELRPLPRSRRLKSQRNVFRMHCPWFRLPCSIHPLDQGPKTARCADTSNLLAVVCLRCLLPSLPIWLKLRLHTYGWQAKATSTSL